MTATEGHERVSFPSRGRSRATGDGPTGVWGWQPYERLPRGGRSPPARSRRRSGRAEPLGGDRALRPLRDARARGADAASRARCSRPSSGRSRATGAPSAGRRVLRLGVALALAEPDLGLARRRARVADQLDQLRRAFSGEPASNGGSRVVLDAELDRLRDLVAGDLGAARCSAMSIPAETPAAVTTLPSSTTRSATGSAPSSRSRSQVGPVAWSPACPRACPAAPSTSEPVQTEVVHVVRLVRARAASRAPPRRPAAAGCPRRRGPARRRGRAPRRARRSALQPERAGVGALRPGLAWRRSASSAPGRRESTS